MSRATPDDQLKFLLSCVRYSNNGKIDFVEVAKECGVVSKGAAAKRYERLLKANGIHPSGGSTEKTANSAPKQKSRAEIARAADAKRRKIENEAYDYQEDDDEDVKPYFKPEPFDPSQIKPEPATEYQPYSWSPMSAPPQQQFFPRQSTPQLRSFQPFRQPFPSTYQSSPVRFPHAVSQPIYSPTAQSVPPSIPRASMDAMPQVQAREANVLQPAPSAVSEDQINSMFEEFCSQDIFKQPHFDLVSSTPSSTRPDRLPVSTPSKEVQMSPRTMDSATIIASVLSESQTQAPVVKEEKMSAAIQTTVPAVAVEKPMGTRFEDSILITD